MEKLKNIIIGIVAVVVLVYGGYSLLTSDLEHIEDTNGPDNYRLQQITDYDIINRDMGALNLTIKDQMLSSLPLVTSKKFTGVADVYTTNVWGNRLDITLYTTEVKSGNLRIVLIHNDEIVHEFRLNELSETYTLQNPDGFVALRVAGESADFKFSYDLI